MVNETIWRLNDCITYLLLTLVFLSSWTDVNGIFSELPQIILTQPEGWKLGTYIGLITNMGNIAPFTLILYKCIFRKKTLNLILINYLIIVIGMTSCFLLVFCWSKTSFIFNENRSIGLLVLSFFLSLLDCTSMVTFSDYMTRFRVQFTSALFLGESLTGVIPSLLALAQGNGQLECILSPNNQTNVNSSATAIYKTARFSVSIYFLCIFVVLSLSLISFVILQWTKIAHDSIQKIPGNSLKLAIVNETLWDATTDVEIINDAKQSTLPRSTYLLLLAGCVYATSVLFGVLLAISAYVLMPYGHRIFYLGTILSPWMLSVVWIFGTIKPFVAKRSLCIIIILGSITFSMNMFISFKSPCPPFVNSINGKVFVLFIWLSTYILLGYSRIVIANYVRIHSSNGMFWFGTAVQFGALIGSLVAYLLVETFSLFREQMPCESSQC